MQTLFPFVVAGVKDAVAEAMAMKTVKSTTVPFEELLRQAPFGALLRPSLTFQVP